jgi:serpin B
VEKGSRFNFVKPDTKRSKHLPRQGAGIFQVLLLVLAIYLAWLPESLTAQVESLVAGNTEFALNLYGRLAAKSGGSNIFLSPYSISTCMAMTYAGARGNTQTQMSQVFGFSTNQEQVASTFAELQSDLLSDEQPNAIELNIANGLWTQVSFPFLPGFLQTAANQYQASVNQADFVANPGGVTQTINDWVAQKTQNRIKQIVPPGAINPLTRLVLANAIYFKGAWTYTFAETNTSIEPFYVSSTSQVDVPLMHQPIIDGGPLFKYMQTPDFQALELPYGSNQLSMLLLLPTRIDGLPQLEEQLSPSFLSNVLIHMAPQPIEILLPRFTNDLFLDLTTVLAQMGASDAFAPGVADFSGMDGMRDLNLSFVFHKAWVQINEAGTEAAAATVGGAGTSAYIPPPPPFVADHPFLFFIRDTQHGNLFFMGRMANPSQAPTGPVTAPNLVLSRAGGLLMISWPHPFTPWTLQQSPDLNGTNWMPVASRGVLLTGPPFIALTTDSTNNSVRVPAPAGNVFFRLTLQ